MGVVQGLNSWTLPLDLLPRMCSFTMIFLLLQYCKKYTHFTLKITEHLKVVFCFCGNIFFVKLQTRGSIPLFWSQRPNLKYKPTPVLNSGADHVSTSCHLYHVLSFATDISRTIPKSTCFIHP